MRCHAYPFRGTDGISALRLDSFEDTELADGNVATGAAKSVQQIFRLTHEIALRPAHWLQKRKRSQTSHDALVIYAECCPPGRPRLQSD